MKLDPRIWNPLGSIVDGIWLSTITLLLWGSLDPGASDMRLQGVGWLVLFWLWLTQWMTLAVMIGDFVIANVRAPWSGYARGVIRVLVWIIATGMVLDNLLLNHGSPIRSDLRWLDWIHWIAIASSVTFQIYCVRRRPAPSLGPGQQA